MLLYVVNFKYICQLKPNSESSLHQILYNDLSFNIYVPLAVAPSLSSIDSDSEKVGGGGDFSRFLLSVMFSLGVDVTIRTYYF